MQEICYVTPKEIMTYRWRTAALGSASLHLTPRAGLQMCTSALQTHV